MGRHREIDPILMLENFDLNSLSVRKAVYVLDEVLVPVTQTELDQLTSHIGHEALSFVEAKATDIFAIHDPPYYLTDHLISFGVVYLDRLLIVDILKKEPEHVKSVEINFKLLRDVEQELTGAIDEDISLTRIHPKLQPDTLEFLRFSGKFVELIADDCDVMVTVSDAKRERFYRKAIEKIGKDNIHLRTFGNLNPPEHTLR